MFSHHLFRVGAVLLLSDIHYGRRPYDPFNTPEHHAAMEDFKKVKKAQARGGSKAKSIDRLNQSNIAKQAMAKNFLRSRAQLTLK